MHSFDLTDHVEYDDRHAHAEPIYVDKHGRAILFTLAPGQAIDEHQAPSSPFYVIILSGQGAFTGGDGTRKVAGPNTLLIFDPGESHSVQALGENLAFIGFLRGVERPSGGMHGA
jgi:quercetin dioxygenase-like cupin family protein